MVLIFSEKKDYSTNRVIDWLWYLGFESKRINTEDTINYSLNLELNEQREIYFELQTEKDSIHIDQIKSCWFRRGFLSSKIDEITLENKSLVKKIEAHLLSERESLTEAFYFLMTKGKHIGHPYKYQVNKLISLYNASLVGFEIPPTFVTRKKEKLYSFQANHGNIITKAIQESLFFINNNSVYSNYTEEITDNSISSIEKEFFPSLFQKKLDKKYELRIFYLKGKCYSMAIFSQEDDKTSVDFRKYNKEKPNRNIPYKLPLKIERKINNFMSLVRLDTGSIDLVVTKDNKYVFLEVNPVGQYDMVTKPCNYYLDKEIALSLVN